jgi:hypothetical protein
VNLGELARRYFAQTPAGAVTGIAPRDDALRGELGYLPRPDGLTSTELSATVTDPRLYGGRATNIPLLVKGQTGLAGLLNDHPVTREQENIAVLRALERLRGGAMLPSYGSIDEALRAAESRPSDVKVPYRGNR